MKDIRKIHREAMQLARRAEQAGIEGDHQLSARLAEEAYLLEKEAANELLAHPASEPTRGVLLRSAATLALQLGKFDEAESLVESGLSGNPFPEIITELRDLQLKILRRKSGNASKVYKIDEEMLSDQLVSESNTVYGVRRSWMGLVDMEALYSSFSAVDKNDEKDMYDVFAGECYMVILIRVGNSIAASDIFRNTVSSYQSYFQQFDIQSIFQARTLLYLAAHHHTTKYCSAHNIDINTHFDNLDKVWSNDARTKPVKRFLEAYQQLSERSITVLRLLLDGKEAGEIEKEMSTVKGSVEDVKKEVINLLPDENQ